MKIFLTKLEKVWFDLFSLLFLVGMFNRELNLFGFDFRLYVVSVGALLFVVNLILFAIDKKRLHFLNLPDKRVLFFLILSIAVNIMWLFNGLKMRPGPFFVVFSACCYNLGVFLLFNINKHLIQWKKISLMIIFAGCILISSIVVSYLGIDLRQYGSQYVGGYQDISAGFISKLRYGGYAQDPNYASLFMVIWLAVAIYGLVQSRKGWLRWVYLAVVPLAIFGFLASSSKSILAITPLAMIIVLINNKYVKIANFGKSIILLSMFLITLLVAFEIIKPQTSSFTILGRMALWKTAVTQVKVSPIIGSGLTSARSATEKINWYIHPHSSIIQILVDMGILGVVLIFLVFKRNLTFNNRLLVFLTIIFMSHFATYETIYQAYFVFMIGLLPLFLSQESPTKSQTAAVFIINGLSNGGAERVVQNMANQICRKHQVIIYTLSESSQLAYQLNPRIKVVTLAKKASTLAAIIASFRLTAELDRLSNTHRIVLATSHLPKSHLATRLSAYNQQMLYVIHGNYGISNNLWNRTFMQFLYNRRKIITVSDGLLRGDMVEKFKIKTRSIKTIYNPIDINAIESRKSANTTQKSQIVTIGRLSPPKRPDLVIQAFAQSGLAKTHKLVVLGQGELRPLVESEITKYQLQNQVELAGFVSNPFEVLQQSSLMVMASEYEAFSMAIAEALICNCPVVTFDVYGANEALTGDLEKFIVPNGNVEALAKKMRLAIDSYPSDLAAIIKPKVDPKKVIDQYFKVYQSWVGF